MKLQRTGHITDVEPAYAAIHAEGLWVFRGLYNVYACEEKAPEPVWKTELKPKQSLLAPRTLYRAGDSVVTVEDLGARYSSRTVTLSIADGAAQPGQQLKVKVGTHGFALLDDRALVHGEVKGKGYSLVQLDAATGKSISSVTTERGNGVCALSGRIYLPAMHGLFVMDKDDEAPQLVMPLRARMFSHDESALYIHQHGGGTEQAVVYVDGRTAKERGRFEQFDDDEEFVNEIVPLRKAGRVLILMEEGAAKVLDLVAHSVVSTLDVPEGWTALSAASTPQGPVLLLEDTATMNRVVAVHEEQTGRRLAELELELEAGLPSTILYVGERVITCGSELSFFSLSKGKQ